MADPGLSEQRRYSYGEVGLETERIYDRRFDGSDNYRELRFYDELGRLAEQHLDDPGGNNAIDGVIDEVIVWSYDEQGRVAQRLFDEGNDGTFDVREERSYDCD